MEMTDEQILANVTSTISNLSEYGALFEAIRLARQAERDKTDAWIEKELKDLDGALKSYRKDGDTEAVYGAMDSQLTLARFKEWINEKH